MKVLEMVKVMEIHNKKFKYIYYVHNEQDEYQKCTEVISHLKDGAIYSFTTANTWKLIAVANSIIYF